MRVELLPLDDGGDFESENSESGVVTESIGTERVGQPEQLEHASVTTAPLSSSLPIPLPVREFLSGKDCLRGVFTNTFLYETYDRWSQN